MAADGEADDLPGDLLSLHVELLGNVAKALPRKARLAFSLTARPLNAARMNANLKLKTSPRALMGGYPSAGTVDRVVSMPLAELDCI